MAKKIQVSFSEKQIELLGIFKGEFGETDADVVRNVVLAWLAEKGFIGNAVRQRMNHQQANAETNRYL